MQDPKNYRYTPTAGLPELRKAIADKTLRDSGYGVDPNQVIVTNGGKQAVYESFQILLNDGDEVIIPTPYWTSYPEAVKLAGACLSKCSRELTAIRAKLGRPWKRTRTERPKPSS